MYQPDLILGDTLVELKTNREPDDLAVAWQLANMLLQDRYDRYGIRHVAAYLARQGVLVSLPVLDLFAGLHDLNDLARLRERYRVARGKMEQKYLLKSQGQKVPRGQESAAAVVGFFLTSIIRG